MLGGEHSGQLQFFFYHSQQLILWNTDSQWMESSPTEYLTSNQESPCLCLPSANPLQVDIITPSFFFNWLFVNLTSCTQIAFTPQSSHDPFSVTPNLQNQARPFCVACVLMGGMAKLHMVTVPKPCCRGLDFLYLYPQQELSAEGSQAEAREGQGQLSSTHVH